MPYLVHIWLFEIIPNSLVQQKLSTYCVLQIFLGTGEIYNCKPNFIDLSIFTVRPWKEPEWGRTENNFSKE